MSFFFFGFYLNISDHHDHDCHEYSRWTQSLSRIKACQHGSCMSRKKKANQCLHSAILPLSCNCICHSLSLFSIYHSFCMESLVRLSVTYFASTTPITACWFFVIFRHRCASLHGVVSSEELRNGAFQGTSLFYAVHALLPLYGIKRNIISTVKSNVDIRGIPLLANALLRGSSVCN